MTVNTVNNKFETQFEGVESEKFQPRRKQEIPSWIPWIILGAIGLGSAIVYRDNIFSSRLSTEISPCPPIEDEFGNQILRFNQTGSRPKYLYLKAFYNDPRDYSMCYKRDIDHHKQLFEAFDLKYGYITRSSEICENILQSRKKGISPNGKIILDSCSTGMKFAQDLVNFSTRNVVAPMKVIYAGENEWIETASTFFPQPPFFRTGVFSYVMEEQKKN